MLYRINNMILLLLLITTCSLMAQEKYAVLITGDYASQGEEFWNDTYLMWEMLVLKNNYDPNNVYVLYADGLDYSTGPSYTYSSGITDYAATKTNVEMVFNGLANGDVTNNIPQMTEDDFLYVWTFDHGRAGFVQNNIEPIGEPGEPRGRVIDNTIAPTTYSIKLMNNNDEWYIVELLENKGSHTYPPGSVYDIDTTNSIMTWNMSNYLNSIQCYKKVVVMSQCFGGAFVEPLENYNTVVLTATNFSLASDVDEKYKDGLSQSAPGEMEYQDNREYRHSEFAYHLLNALNGETPDGYDYYHTTNYGDFPLSGADSVNDGFITIKEAFNWAKDFESDGWAVPQWSDNGNIGLKTSIKYPTVLSSNISSSIILRGEIAVTNTISILSGATLTVKPGSTIKVKPGKSIIVYGSLNAVGTSAKPIVFDKMEGTSWGGIDLINAATCTLKYCEVKDALYGNQGIYIKNSDPYIEHCYIHNNTYGVYIDNYAEPVFYNNTISNNLDGVKCYNQSEPQFGETAPGYNHIKNNTRFGFNVTNSHVFLGMDAGQQPVGGMNSIFNNSGYNLYAISSSQINADWNFWNTSNPWSTFYKSSSSSIYLSYTSQDSSGGSALAKSNASDQFTEEFDPDIVDRKNPEELLRLAFYFKYTSKYREAIDVLESIIYDYTGTDYVLSAMTQLYSISKRYEELDIEKYCNDKIASKETAEIVKRISYDILVSKYLSDNKNSDAEDMCNNILRYYPDSESEKYALFNLFVLSTQNETKSAETYGYLKELDDKYPNDPLTFEARTIIGAEVDWSLAKESREEAEYETVPTLVPSEFTLYPSFPNPFNPSTTISFYLPEASKIIMEIYTVQGQKIWFYPGNNTELPSGNHSIIWEGTSFIGRPLPSGMYILKFWSEKYYSSQKLLLIK